ENVNGYVLDGIYTDQVANLAHAQPGDARAAFEADSARYTRVVSATLDVVDFPDSASAYRFGLMASHATTLRGAAAMAKDGPQVRTVELAFPTADPEWASVEPTIRSLQESQAMGPYPVGGKFRAFQLMAKRTERASFETLDPESRMRLEQMSVEVARERRL